jgi:flavorubredoxin
MTVGPPMAPAPPPLEVAVDTFLLRGAHPVAGAPLLVGCNALLIRAAQPVVIDLGAPHQHDRWVSELAMLVDPAAVRWLVLTQGAAHHRGRLADVLQRCPNAIMVTSWSGALAGDADAIPPERQHWVDPGDRLAVGDRELRVLLPPVYASPHARALFDPTTGVLWACDAFAAPVPPPGVDAAEQLSPALWLEGMTMLAHHAIAPWLATIDRAAYRAQVDRLQELGAEVVVGAHTPAITGASLDVAFGHLAALPDLVPPPHPASMSGGASTFEHPSVADGDDVDGHLNRGAGT